MNMMICCNIIQYYTPNNIWKIPMLNQMSGGSWQRHNLEKKCKRIWLHIRGMRKGIEGTCQLSRKHFQISFIEVQIVQSLIIQQRRQGRLNIVEWHKKNRKKNHEISKEEGMIIKMKNMRFKNKKLLKKGLNWKLMTLKYIWS